MYLGAESTIALAKLIHQLLNDRQDKLDSSYNSFKPKFVELLSLNYKCHDCHALALIISSLGHHDYKGNTRVKNYNTIISTSLTPCLLIERYFAFPLPDR